MRWLAILSLLFASSLRSELLPIRAYTAADGLAADHVECIVPDSRGFLWFCTPEGLSRFDGRRFVTYGVEEGLAHRAVSALLETRSGEYLVGTARGISRVDSTGQGGRFTTYAPQPEAARNHVVALHQSRSGKLWCATFDSLYQWSRTGGFHRIPLPLPPGPGITSIVEAPDGDLWIGATEGIYRLSENGVVQILHIKDGLPGEWVEMLLVDSRGRLWAALRGGLALITRGEAGHWRVERVYTDDSGLPTRDIKALLAASDGTLWVGTSQGISRLRLDAGEPAVSQNLTREQGLSDRQIISLAEDQAGNIWAGTEGAGAMRIDRLGFTTYREQDGLRTDRVFSVFEDRAGELLAASLAGSGSKRSVDLFDGRRFHAVTPQVFGDRASWGWNQIFLQSRTGEWWAATKNGLCRYPALTAAQLAGRNPRICYAPDNDVFRIFEDSKGGIWASAQSPQRDQLMRWDPQTDSVFRFPNPRVPGEPANDLVAAFAEDPQGNIWMGLYKGGLYRYDGREIRYFQQRDGFPAGIILSLLVSGRSMWIGSTGGGLGRVLNTADVRPQVDIYNMARGMASDIITCIIEDRQGRIYAGTSKGVDRLDPKTGHILHFSSGLAHGELTAALRDRSGSLWFATKQGLSRIVPAEDRPPVHPRVFITDLRVGGALYPLSQLGETRISLLALRPSQNQLQVEFVGLDYEPGDTLHYSYQLEGADSGWSPLRTLPTVNFAALSSGQYRFLVKAVTSEGVESASPAEIDFTVLPPIWRRWWFESLAVALAAALVFAGHRYRVTQMVNLERMRTAIATDLHDDIGASLSQIAILSEVARVGGDGQGRPGEPLERIATLARELVDSMSDIVWSIRSEPHGMGSLTRRMREFALDLLVSQGIAFEFLASAESVPLSLQARRELFLWFKECVHNAARHSGCTAVKAELAVEDHQIVLSVEDNGCGLNSSERRPGETGGNGIPGMQRRAESLGGRMQLTSERGRGCRVTIHVPMRHRAFAKAL